MKLLASNKVVDSEYELAANDIRRIRTLMEDIECIVSEQFLEIFGWEDVDGYNEQQSKMIKLLCDAVCTNFPTN